MSQKNHIFFFLSLIFLLQNPIHSLIPSTTSSSEDEEFSISNSQFFDLNNLPTLRFSLDGKNLAEIEKIIVTKLLGEKEVTIPEIAISETIDIIGQIDFSLSNMLFKVSNDSDADLSIAFEEEKDINFVLNFLQGELTFDYSINSIFLSSQGNGTLLLNNISLTLYNTFIQVDNKNENYKKGPGIQVNSIGINNIDMNFIMEKNGTFEKFIKYFDTNLKSILVGLLANQLNRKENLQKINDQLKDLFAGIILSFPIELPGLFNASDNVNVSFSMNTLPMVKDELLEVAFEAELLSDKYVFDEKNNITLPSLLNNSELIDKENVINGIVSQFLFNNVLDILAYYGKLNTVITNDTMGLSEITIGVISAIIPEITNGYKASQKVEIIINTNESPVIKLKNNNEGTLLMKENVQFFAYPPETTKNEEGTIPVDGDTEIQIDFDFYVNDTVIEMTIKGLKMISFTVNKSLVGDIDTDRVVKNFNSLTTLMLSQINNKIKEIIGKIEFPITIYEINLLNLIAQSNENYIKISISPAMQNIFEMFWF